MKCRRLTTLDESTAGLLEQSHSAFSSPLFAQIWSQIGGRPVWWTVHEGERLVAVLPAVEFGFGPLTRLQAMPDGCYAVLPGATGDDVKSALLNALHRYGYLKAFLYDFDISFPLRNGVSVHEHTTRIVDIAADNWEPPDSNLRSEIRKAERDGVVIGRLDPDKDLGRVVLLAERTAEEHNQSLRYGVAFLQALAYASQKTSLVRWYVAVHESAIVASHIYLVHNEQLLYWQAYLDREAAPFRPNQLLTHTAVADARRDGLTLLNLGATPEDAEGLRFYKERWGGREIPYRSLQWKSMLGKLL